MAVWLELLPYPSYLSEHQHERYGRAIHTKATDPRAGAAADHAVCGAAAAERSAERTASAARGAARAG